MVILPVQFTHRELDARLFVAGRLARAGQLVAVGETGAAHQLGYRTRAGLYLGRDIVPVWRTRAPSRSYRRLKARGHRVLHLDEEGTFYGDETDRERTLLRRVNPHLLEDDDWICAWGSAPAQTLRSAEPRLADHVVVTGHPRFDLYKPRYRDYWQDDVAALRARFGRFVLASTSFPAANHKQGPGRTFWATRDLDLDDPAQRMTLARRWAHVARTVPRFIELIHRISAELPAVRVVVRPHPSEDARLYHRALAGLAGVTVVREGPMAPWILASEGLLQSSCTSAVEAHLADKPVVTFLPTRSRAGEKALSRAFGAVCEREVDAVAAVAALWAGRPLRGGEGEQARPELATLERDSLDAVAELAARVDARGRRQTAAALRATARVADAVARAVRRRDDVLRARHERFRWKYPHPDRADTERRLARVARLLETELRLSWWSPYLFAVEGR